MVCCLVRVSESRLIFRLYLVESWIQSAVQSCREHFVQRWQRADPGGSFLTFSTSPCLCITFILTFFHASGVNSFCFLISLKFCLTISLVSSSLALVSSALIPVLSADSPFFFESVDCSLQLFTRDLWNSFHLSRIVALIVNAVFSLIVFAFQLSFIIFVVVIFVVVI